jgi:hypothetical protein
MFTGARAPQRKRGPRWGVVLASVGAVVVVSLLTGGISRLLKSNTDELPTYAGFRPVYGTAVFTVDETIGTSRSKATVTTDAAGKVIHMVFSADSTSASVDMITDGATAYAWSPQSNGWIHDNFTAPDAFDAIVKMTRVSIFNDWVPETARQYVDVFSKDDRLIDGQPMTRYELHIHVDDFKRAQPQAFATWSAGWGKYGGDAGTLRLVLSVDKTGTVWQFETWSDLSSDRSTYTLKSFTEDVFSPPYPTSYLDMLHDGGPVEVTG